MRAMKNKCKTCGRDLPSKEGDFTTFMNKTIKRVFRRMDNEYKITKSKRKDIAKSSKR